ncbi:MAG: hypothetical protein ACXWWA_10265 [Chitinophagaceae bacterium]
MLIQKKFIRFASICCFLSVITTLGIHAFFPDPPSSFEERLLLFRNTTYLANRWWVIAHCLLVVASMWGFALLQFKKAPGLTGLGFLFFSVFAIAEITRQMIVLFYMNGLREQYLNATDTGTRDGIKLMLSYAPLLTAPLFGVFILAFGLGGICYGFSLLESKGFSKLIAIMMIISGIASFVLLGNDFWRSASLGRVIEKYNLSFTPLLRLLTAIWLWKKSNSLASPLISPKL